MTNGLALFLVIAIAGFLALDYYVIEMDVALFLAREGLELIRMLAFWR